MSQSEPSLDDLKQRFLRGEIDADELRAGLRDLDTETARDELWTRWAEQGLFDDPIDQRGFESHEGGQVRQVDDGG